MNAQQRILSLFGISVTVFVISSLIPPSDVAAAALAQPLGLENIVEPPENNNGGRDSGVQETPPDDNPPPRDARNQDDDRGRRKGRGRFRGQGAQRGKPRPGHAPWGPDGKPRRRFELNDEIISRSMEFLKENLPNWHDKLDRLRQERPWQFRKTLRAMLPALIGYGKLKDREPEMAQKILQDFEIEYTLRQLSEEYQKASVPPERLKTIEKEMESLIRQQIELRLALQEFHVQEFEKELQRQKAKLREEKKPEQVERNVAKQLRQLKEGKLNQRDRDRMHQNGGRGRGKHRDGPPEEHGAPPRPGGPDGPPVGEPPPDSPPPEPESEEA